MDIKTKEIYSEVYAILEFLGNEYKQRLPKQLLESISNNRNTSYTPKFTDDVPLDKQEMSKQTKAMIAFLYITYWCEFEANKIYLKRKFIENM